ncbi:MAG: TcpQ domain-containing protein [Burkholderiaceae bacterium]|nr:TcpQ domain-containing protein [Burkholderiaceae bacterium]
MLKPLVGAVVLFLSFAQAHAQRIEHVGPVIGGEVASSPVEMRTDLLTAARTIFPPAWNGFAQKGLDVRRASAVRIQPGESWLAALDRWLAQENLTARLDWNARKFYLRPGADMAAPPQPSMQMTGVNPVATYSQPQYQQARQWAVLTSDVRLETTLERWAKDAGYRLIWDADRHILISAADQFVGTLPDAINRVLNSPAIRDSDYPLEAVFYSNTPPVIRITRLGDQSSKE